MLRLADAARHRARRRPGRAARRARRRAAGSDYAVIHAAPMFRYKQWTLEGWRALAAALAERGLTVVATGGPAEAERRYLDAVWARRAGAPPRRPARLAAARRPAGQGARLCRARYLGHPSRRRRRLPDRRALRPDRSAAVGPLAGGRPRRDVAGGRHACSGAAMSGWCRTRCPACRASWRAASGGWRATARVLDELSAGQVISGGGRGARRYSQQAGEYS